MTKITKTDMPAPDTIIDYGDGRTGMAMFFYGMPESARADHIAAANGFDTKFCLLDGDVGEAAEELQFRYEQGEDPFAIAKDWHPKADDGWVLAEKYDTEEGLIALFVKAMPGEQVGAA